MRKGKVFDAGEADWLRSHAALPVAQRMSANLYRVFFSGRDEQGRGRIGYFELDLGSPATPRRVSTGPVLSPGSLGAFDDHGVTTSWLEQAGDLAYLYYTGWSLGVTVPFYFWIGLALSEDRGLSFRRFSRAPILGPGEGDPFLTASPCILRENGTWRMWYVSGVKWVATAAGPRHYYHIKYAESADGLSWDRAGRVCIDFVSDEEYAIARPCVIHDGGVYRMWYCYRGESYRLGYAESHNGLEWTRRDAEAGLPAADRGWDSEMVAYPFVFGHKGTRHMLYNGNGYGRSGIGLAVLEEKS